MLIYSFFQFRCGQMEEDPRHPLLKSVQFLHYGIFLFLTTVTIGAIITPFTKPMHQSCVSLYSKSIDIQVHRYNGYTVFQALMF